VKVKELIAVTTFSGSDPFNENSGKKNMAEKSEHKVENKMGAVYGDRIKVKERKEEGQGKKKDA
jgi:hypothetical protein